MRLYASSACFMAACAAAWLWVSCSASSVAMSLPLAYAVTLVYEHAAHRSAHGEGSNSVPLSSSTVPE